MDGARKKQLAKHGPPAIPGPHASAASPTALLLFLSTLSPSSSPPRSPQGQRGSSDHFSDEASEPGCPGARGESPPTASGCMAKRSPLSLTHTHTSRGVRGGGSGWSGWAMSVSVSVSSGLTHHARRSRPLATNSFILTILQWANRDDCSSRRGETGYIAVLLSMGPLAWESTTSRSTRCMRAGTFAAAEAPTLKKKQEWASRCDRPSVMEVAASSSTSFRVLGALISMVAVSS